MTAVRYVAGAGAIGGLFAACALAIKHWHNEKYPLMHWPCDQCPTEFADRDPIRLDQAIREHRLAHSRNRREVS